MKHNISRRTALATLIAGVAAYGVSSPMAWAQSWPAKPIRLIVPFPPGGATDASARLIADHLARRLGQGVVVDNKPGASTIIGMEAAAKAAPDGYTFLVTGGGSLAVLPALRNDLPYNVEKNFTSIALLVTAPVVLVTATSKPYMKLSDFVAAAKAKPKDLRYSTYGAGSAPHLAGEMFAQAAGIEIEPIPFKGASDSLLAELRGDVDLGFETLSAASPHIKSGKLRVLSLNSEGRSSFLPNSPGLGELGYGAAAIDAFYCMSAVAGTPHEITARVSKEVLEIMALPDVKEKLAAMFLEANTQGPAGMDATIKMQTARYKQAAQKANITLAP